MLHGGMAPGRSGASGAGIWRTNQCLVAKGQTYDAKLGQSRTDCGQAARYPFENYRIYGLGGVKIRILYDLHVILKYFL